MFDMYETMILERAAKTLNVTTNTLIIALDAAGVWGLRIDRKIMKKLEKEDAADGKSG